MSIKEYATVWFYGLEFLTMDPDMSEEEAHNEWAHELDEIGFVETTECELSSKHQEIIDIYGLSDIKGFSTMTMHGLEYPWELHIYGFTFTTNNMKDFYIVREIHEELVDTPNGIEIKGDKTIGKLVALIREL